MSTQEVVELDWETSQCLRKSAIHLLGFAKAMLRPKRALLEYLDYCYKLLCYQLSLLGTGAFLMLASLYELLIHTIEMALYLLESIRFGKSAVGFHSHTSHKGFGGTSNRAGRFASSSRFPMRV